MFPTTWQRLVTLLVAPVFAMAGLVAIAVPAQGEPPGVDPVTIDGCTVTVPALQGVNYFQDKGNDPYLSPGSYDAKHFYPSTTFTARLATEGNEQLGQWTIKVPGACAEFTDVPDNSPFADEIAWLVREEITTGYPDGTFRPRGKISREAMAAYLYRLAGKPSVDTSILSDYTDVSPGDQFAVPIAFLANEQITTGYADHTFRPRGKITRQATAAFLWRYTGLHGWGHANPPEYPDVPKSNKFRVDIQWLALEEITTGYPDGKFHPGRKITREAMAAFLYRYNEKGLPILGE